MSQNGCQTPPARPPGGPPPAPGHPTPRRGPRRPHPRPRPRPHRHHLRCPHRRRHRPHRLDRTGHHRRAQRRHAGTRMDLARPHHQPRRIPVQPTTTAVLGTSHNSDKSRRLRRRQPRPHTATRSAHRRIASPDHRRPKTDPPHPRQPVTTHPQRPTDPDQSEQASRITSPIDPRSPTSPAQPSSLAADRAQIATPLTGRAEHTAAPRGRASRPRQSRSYRGACHHRRSRTRRATAPHPPRCCRSRSRRPGCAGRRGAHLTAPGLTRACRRGAPHTQNNSPVQPNASANRPSRGPPNGT